MTRGTQAGLAGVLALLFVLALGGVLYLSFIFPRTVAVWSFEARALSGPEQILVHLGGLSTTHGRLLIPGLLLGMICCGAWAALAGGGRRQ